MLEPRLYRATLLAGVAALVLLMFSVVSPPQPLRANLAPDAFDGQRALAVDRQLIGMAPDRRPGSAGDLAAARFVETQLRAVRGGQLSEQSLSGRFNGNDVSLHNVSLLLPGNSDHTVVVLAGRDCASGPCAASSAAATAALVELAASFDGVQHQKSLLFVSTDGSAAGAAGARALAARLRGQPVDAAIVISQPGAATPRRPFVLPFSSGTLSASAQLVSTAQTAVGAEVPGRPQSVGALSSLLRLAIPSGLGEQAPLIQSGLNAVAISSAGERPLPSSEDGPGSLSGQSLDQFGRAALSLTLAIDADSSPLVHGPSTYISLAGKLIPGWALALLALSLLLPIGVYSGDAIVRLWRRHEPVPISALWVLSRAAPFAALLALAYLMAFVRLLPAPQFPYDPAAFGFDLGALLSLVPLVGVLVLTLRLVRRFEPPVGSGQTVSAAVGGMLFLVGGGLWLVNPFLCLLLVPTLHLWLIAASPELRGQVGPPLVALGAGMLGPLLLLVGLAGHFGVGWQAPWQLLLLFTGGHFGSLAAAPLCALAGCFVCCVELAFRDPSLSPPRPRPLAEQLVRLSGPGSLGGPPSRPAGTRRGQRSVL